MRWLSKFQGALSHSRSVHLVVVCYHTSCSDGFYGRLDRAVVARYFAFLAISQLIIFTLIGVGFSERWFFPSIVL